MPSSRDGIRSLKPLRVKVVVAQAPREYTNSSNKKMVVVEVVVSDNTGYKKLSCYNKNAFAFLKEGNSVMLLNVIVKPKEIVATSEAKVIIIPDIEVPDDIMQRAKNEPILTVSLPFTDLSIQEVKEQPAGTTFNVIGKIIELDNSMTVNTQWGTTVDVRNGRLADNTGSVYFAFWRNLAHFPLEEGQVIKISNGQLSSTSTECAKITGGRYTTIEILSSHLLEEIECDVDSMQEAEIIGIASCDTYKSCNNPRCYKKKLINDICPSCSKTSTEDINSVVCSVLVEEKDEYKELTLFTSQVEELIKKPISPEKKEVEKELLTVIPVKIKYLESLKRDKTLSKLKRQ